MPRTLARPTVRSGSRTSPALTAADSTPRKLYSSSAAEAASAPETLWPEALNGPKLSASTKNRPIVASRSSGTNFRIVETTCTVPTHRVPAKFAAAGSQRAAMATAACRAWLPCRGISTST